MEEYGRGKSVQIQLPNGNIMTVPADSAAAVSASASAGNMTKAMNISEELNRSGVWKNVNDGNVIQSQSSFSNKPTCRNNRRRQK